MTLNGHYRKVDKINMITTVLVTRYMSSEKPDVARGLRRMKTETDKVISASNEAR